MKNVLVKTAVIILLLLPQNSFGQSANEFAPPIYKSRIVKVDFFSPMTGDLSFDYEQDLMNNITLEGSLGIIGISFIDDSYNPKGLFLKAGPKFYFTPDYTFDGLKRYNDFQGSYFKPEIVYSGFGFDYETYNTITYQYVTERGINNSVALMLNLGKQWVLAKILTLDLHAGIGYGKSWNNIKESTPGSYPTTGEDYVSYKYSHFEVPTTPLTLSAGFTMGILLK